MGVVSPSEGLGGVLSHRGSPVTKPRDVCEQPTSFMAVASAPGALPGSVPDLPGDLLPSSVCVSFQQSV